MRRLAPLSRALFAAPPLAMSLALASCGGENNAPPVVIPSPTPTPTPSSTPTPGVGPVSYDVTPCLQQLIPGTDGATPASLVVPDTLKLDTGIPSGFPNGRTLTDPVIDVTLAVLFLDVNAPGQSPATFAKLPLNPAANDKPFLTTFPYLAAPQGTPPLASGTGSGFHFRTDDPAAYARVDRMGMPAVATALVGSSLKNAYNDDNPGGDAVGTYVPEFVKQLTILTNTLGDDLTAAGFKLCAKPK